MILRALYDYYQRCDGLPQLGLEHKQIGFLIVISREGEFLRFEDRRIDKKTAQEFCVKKSVARSSGVVANYLYDNSQYVFGYAPSKGDMAKMRKYFDAFKNKVEEVFTAFPDNESITAVHKFYQQQPADIVAAMAQDPLWNDIEKNLEKKFSSFSFLIDGDTRIVAEQQELMPSANEDNNDADGDKRRCLITGTQATTVTTTTATMIAGSQATARLVAFQISSGYDSYGKQQGDNAPISEQAEFAYTTALNHLLRQGSRNKFMIGSRTYLFWASSRSAAAQATEEGLFAFLGAADSDNPNDRVELVRDTFLSIYNGKKSMEHDDKFFILGLAPNAARIATVYWSEIPLRAFAGIISRHFNDMAIIGGRKDKKPYAGLHAMLSAVTRDGKSSEVIPNLPDALVKSIFQGLPYPATLFQACIRRIRAEQKLTVTRAAIIKAYLNRLNHQKLDIMLDKENTNQGYLCGRLFAVLDKMQEEANNIHTIRERYMNAASATPSTVFATLLNLSVHHQEKLTPGRQITFEKLKQEIIANIAAKGFPTHLDLQDQGRFFVGYYHQRQDFFVSKENKETAE